MQNQYTKQALSAIRFAASEAKRLKHPYIGTEHLLLGLRKEYTGVAGQVLAQHGVDEEKILKLMDKLVVPSEGESRKKQPEESPRLRCILEDGIAEAGHFHMRQVGTEHLLMAMIRDVDCVAARILITMNINLQKLFQDILAAAGMDPKVSRGNASRNGCFHLYVWK